MENKHRSGVLYAVSAYLFWGLTPLYWKLFSGIAAIELMAHRVFWAFFASILILVVTGQLLRLKDVLLDRRRMFFIIIRTLFLALNWYTYIWAVSSGRVLEASLGYYLNPLVSIFLGLIFLHERLTRLQWTAVGFAAAGVALKTFLVGSFPLVSVILAFSFGFYGLLKKKGGEGSLAGMGAESLVLLPASAFGVFFLEASGSGSFLASGMLLKLLYVSTGFVTVFPLILFAKGTNRIPLTWIGFLQFIAPTMMLIFGVFVYHELFSAFEFAGFACVWIGIVIFLISARKR